MSVSNQNAGSGSANSNLSNDTQNVQNNEEILSSSSDYENSDENSETEEEMTNMSAAEALDLFKQKRKEAITHLDFDYANECQKQIEDFTAREVKENMKEFTDNFIDKCSDLYEIYQRKYKHLIKRAHQMEVDIRTDISKRFQSTEVLHLARLSQFDEEFFAQYTKAIIGTEDVKYTYEIEKAKKLALRGEYIEAEQITSDARARHAKFVQQKEDEITTQYKARSQLIFDAQSRDFSTLSSSLSKALAELEKAKNIKITQLQKNLRLELDRCYQRFNENLAKHFTNFKNEKMKLTPKEILDRSYKNFLMKANIIPKKVEKIKTEQERKKAIQEEKEARIRAQEEEERKRQEEQEENSRRERESRRHSKKVKFDLTGTQFAENTSQNDN